MLKSIGPEKPANDLYLGSYLAAVANAYEARSVLLILLHTCPSRLKVEQDDVRFRVSMVC